MLQRGSVRFAGVVVFRWRDLSGSPEHVQKAPDALRNEVGISLLGRCSGKKRRTVPIIDAATRLATGCQEKLIAAWIMTNHDEPFRESIEFLRFSLFSHQITRLVTIGNSVQEVDQNVASIRHADKIRIRNSAVRGAEKCSVRAWERHAESMLALVKLNGRRSRERSFHPVDHSRSPNGHASGRSESLVDGEKGGLTHAVRHHAVSVDCQRNMIDTPAAYCLPTRFVSRRWHCSLLRQPSRTSSRGPPGSCAR